MKPNTPMIVIGIALLSIVIFILYITVFPWAMLYLGISALPDPPAPKITHGEFPFRLEYKINGKSVVVEDTLICEYDGVGMDEGRGKFRKWKGYLSSGNERVSLSKANDNLEIYYPIGSAKFYMGDTDYPSTNQSFPDAARIQKNGNITSDGIVLAEELLKKYNIKLISWDYTKPIENKFK